VVAAVVKVEDVRLAANAAVGVVTPLARFEAEAANVRFRAAGNRVNGGLLSHP
jgi:hypothetical protein